MDERFTKLFTLQDITNMDEAPVKVEAGGLIKDNVSGRVIGRMYLKNASEKPVKSVLVGFYPKDADGRPVRGMRDYRYDASDIQPDVIYGDETGIIFEDDNTKSFSFDVKEVEFEDGGYWDKESAEKAAPEEGFQEAPSMGIDSTPDEVPEPVQALWIENEPKAVSPEVWNDASETVAVDSREAIEQEKEEEEEAQVIPAQPQLEYSEPAKLVEETDAYKKHEQESVIKLDGPNEDDQPVIELGGPTEQEKHVRLADMASGFASDLDADIDNGAYEPVAVRKTDAFIDSIDVDNEAGQPQEISFGAEEDTSESSQYAPKEPEAPVEPEVPTEPEAPAAPEAPVEPQPEAAPDEEKMPEEPAEPETPVEQVEPEAQAEPEAQTEPEPQAEAPAVPEEPAESEAPAEPEPQPEPQPEAKPEEPEKPAGSEVEPVSNLETIAVTPDTKFYAPSEEIDAEKSADASAGDEEKTENAANPAETPAEVFAQDSENVPSIIDNKQQKALTGEDYSGRNLMNIIIFGAIALAVLFFLLTRI